MAPRKPKVVVTRKLPDAIETRMRELFDTDLNLDDTPMDVEALVAAMSRADVLAPTITDKLELRVGRDLQYVRINGTIVGFLVGGFLYAVLHAIFGRVSF